ncbi:MAG: HAD-IIIA family hydrolase [Pseudomonadales bacterium]|nr:HAD-IIIA family hydrolase [Pseudomonadales bacterium]
MTPELKQLAQPIKLAVFDIDGIMTDGRLYFTSLGDEIKAFNVKDGLGLKLLRDTGVEVAIITGRTSELVKRRANDLKIEKLVQGREDKKTALKELLKNEKLSPEQVAYMGDDLPDLAAIRYVGLGVTVADGLPLVKQHANLITEKNGGDGAVREFCEWLMLAQGTFNQVMDNYLD